MLTDNQRYAGLLRRKSALTIVFVVSATNAMVIFQWFFWGYSLAFSSTATNGYIGNLQNFALRFVLDAASPGSPLLPELLYSGFQLEFACVTACILVGGVAERGRVLPAVIFIFFWMTLVYCPIAHWVWAQNGWAFKYGVLDYAGGGPVEIASGVGGLAYAWALGRRRESELVNFRPHNVSLVALGTFLLWFGWLGFNGGSAFGANLRAVMAAWNSMISAAFGGLTWCLLDFRIERKYTMVGFCSGTIAGLVAATPSSGFVEPWVALVMGITAGGICNFATKLKFLMRIDDALDIFAEHAIGGIIGLIFNALFATNRIIGLDVVNMTLMGGWLDHHYAQLYIQVAYICATVSYTFVVTALIAKAIDLVPGLRLRTTDEGETIGVDEMEIGEFANDYIEVRRHFQDWSSGNTDAPDELKTTTSNDTHVAAGDRHGGANKGNEPVNTHMEEKTSSSNTGGPVAAGDRHGAHGGNE